MTGAGVVWVAAMLVVAALGMGLAALDSSPDAAAAGTSVAVPVDAGSPGGSDDGPAQVLSPERASADSSAGPSTDDADRVTYFDPSNLIDNRPDTAWRTPGDASGQSLYFSFASPVRLSSVGLVSGYAKIDPVSGVDRFVQNRRVSSVEWTSAEGESVTQWLTDDPTLQTISVELVTQSVTVTVTSTLLPGDSSRDYTAISEVVFTGWPG